MPSLRELITKAYDEQEELMGSARQVTWATQISEQKLPEAVKMLGIIANQVKIGDTTQAEYLEAVRRVIVMIKETRATWWINHRDDPVDYLLCGSPRGFFRQ